MTSASLEDGREAYDSYGGYTGDELLMLVVRDLTGTLDTEAELARSQRQTEMILRAAAEGVVGTDTDGRVVLVNPAAAQHPRLPRRRARRAGAAPADPRQARRRLTLPVRGVTARRHPQVRPQAPGPRAGPVGEEAATGCRST
ncbi:hypothetical protein STANM309S_05470 [Streptomyces tanashiensis]